MSRVVGFTTTIPVEVLLAADIVPVDLNNIFICAPDSAGLVATAEREGYPRNTCAWIKGIYAVTLARSMGEIIAVTQGDCSQTHAMMETLQVRGVRVFPFAYPSDRNRGLLVNQMQRMAEHFGTTLEQAEAVRRELLPLRQQLAELDRLTWQNAVISGFENHDFLVSATDFSSDVKGFATRLEKLVTEAQARRSNQARLRIGVIGVPPIITDFYPVLDGLGVQVVFNEMQRQFSMTQCADCDLVDQYLRYTYPYDVFGRIEDINREIQRRRIDGIVHYTQTFCFRQIQGILLKQRLTVPVLEIEGDRPGPVNAQNRLRLEAFVETLEARAGRGRI